MSGFKLPGFGGKQTNIKGGMDRKYGTGEYSRSGKKFAERMKPGESKFNYDVRMREQARKSPSTKSTSTYQAPDPSAEVSTGGPSYGYQTQERNPGDLREQSSWSSSVLPSAPGDPFKYDFNEEGNIMFKDTRKGEDASWETPKPHQEKAIRERYTGSETGGLENWYGHDTYSSYSSYDVDPVSGEMIDESWRHEGYDRKESYLPYDLAQKKYNPKYKGSKK